MFSITTTMIDIASVFSHTDKFIAAIDSWTTINFISEGSPRQYNNAKSSNLSHGPVTSAKPLATSINLNKHNFLEADIIFLFQLVSINSNISRSVTDRIACIKLRVNFCQIAIACIKFTVHSR